MYSVRNWPVVLVELRFFNPFVFGTSILKPNFDLRFRET